MGETPLFFVYRYLWIIYRNIVEKKIHSNTSINESLNYGSKLGEFEVISDNTETKHGHGIRKLGNWPSDNAWDLKAPIGTSVYSFTNGVVSKIFQSRPGSAKIYGTQVSIRGVDGNPDIFYTHIEGVTLKTGDKVKVGDFIGKIQKWPANPSGSHVHIGLPNGKDLGELVSRNKIDMKKFETGNHNDDTKTDNDDDKKTIDKSLDTNVTPTKKSDNFFKSSLYGDSSADEEDSSNYGLIDKFIDMVTHKENVNPKDYPLFEEIKRIKQLLK